MRLANQLIVFAFIGLIVFAATHKPASPPDKPLIGTAPHVLIVADSREPYTNEQSAALNSAQAGDIDAWCRLNCAQANGAPEKRVYDPDEDVSKESRFWQDAMKRDHGTLPSVETYGRKWSGPRTFKDAAELTKILTATKSEN